MSKSSAVHVAVGVILNSSNEVLVSLRPIESHQGGLWEFPGGKLEIGEDVRSALKRELAEELGIEVIRCFPLKKIRHDYADKSVFLDVWTIAEYLGSPRGLEGQAVEWRSIQDLKEADFPVANAPIIRTLNLAELVAITPNVANFTEFTELIENLLRQHLRIIQFRQTQLDSPTAMEWFEWAQALCARHGARLMFNQEVGMGSQSNGFDLHASSERLMSLKTRPVDQALLFSASCHSLEQLKHAEALGADFVLLSPVAASPHYSAEQLLGWSGFEALATQVSVPVYALGGLAPSDLGSARAHGASGIAGISSFQD